MTILRDIDLETGDLTQFDSVADTNGKLAATGPAALEGSFGLACTHDSTSTQSSGNVTGLSLPNGPWRFKFSFDPNGVVLGGAIRTGMIRWNSIEFEIAVEGGLELYVSPIGGGVQKIPITDAPHTVECRVDPLANTIDLWIDQPSNEPPDASYTGLTLPVYSSAIFGLADAPSASGTFYLDKLVISDDDTPLVALPAPRKFGVKDCFFYYGGIDMLVNSIQGIEFSPQAIQEETSGVGDEWEAQTPTGDQVATLTQEGAFFDDATNAIHDAMSDVESDPNAAPTVTVIGVMGKIIGALFHGIVGAYNRLYAPLTERQALTKANVEYGLTGPLELGTVLHPMSQEVADFDTESTPVDNGAATANGGAGYQAVQDANGITGFVGSIRHSSDSIIWADLLTFTDNVAAPFAERVAVTGTVERYTAYKGLFTGAGDVTAFGGFRREP